MKNRLLVLTALLTAALVLSACGSGSQTASLSGTSWTLVSFGPADAQTAAVEGIQTSLIFDLKGNISGNMGCNSFGGKYEVTGDTVSFSEVISTMMACADPRMNQERAAFKILNSSATFKLDGDTLKLCDTSGADCLLLKQARQP